MTVPAKRTAVVLTAIAVETKAVLRHLSGVNEETERGTVFSVGFFEGWRVAVGETGEGNAAAANITERAIARYQPDVALFVGIAGGLKGVNIGDVVIAELVYPYEKGKVTDEGFHSRPGAHRPTYAALKQGSVLKSTWRARQTLPDSGGRVFVKPVAAGEKVVGTTKAELYVLLRSRFDDALAVEMGGCHGLTTHSIYKG